MARLYAAIAGLLSGDPPADEIPWPRSWGSRESFGTRVSRVFSPLSSSRPASSPALPAAATSTHAKGIDVSNWNGTINWTKVAHAGYKFAIAKATEATNYEDTTYVANRSGSQAAGLAFGAYHFARPSGTGVAAATASAVAQADYFLGFATPQPGELPPVLDLEATGNLSARLLQAWTEAWAQEVYARLGVHPIVYSSPAFWQEHLDDSTGVAAAGTPLWIAHWTSASKPWIPAQNWNGLGWTFWQWTNCASVPGIAHCTDGDRMNGASPASLEIAPYSQDAPTLSTAPTIVGIPEAGKLLSAVPGVWDGGKPLAFTYQWRQCDAAGANCVDIAGATREKYRPTSGDVGHSLSVRVTAATAAATAKATAPPTVAVSPAGTPPTAASRERRSRRSFTERSRSARSSRARPEPGRARRRSSRTAGSAATRAASTAPRSRRRLHAAYTPTPDDLGSTLALVVTASGAGGSASAHSVDIRRRRRRAAAASLRPARRRSSRVSPETSARSTAARPRRGSRAPSPSASP